MARQHKKKSAPPSAVVNRRARFDYALGDEITTGVVLSGPETRAARDGRVHLKGAFVTIRNGELWLNNASFSVAVNGEGQHTTSVDSRARKLLASKRQIDSLQSQKQAGFSIVPLRLLTRGRFVKLVIALGKGKKNYDKRQAIKSRDQERDVRQRV